LGKYNKNGNLDSTLCLILDQDFLKINIEKIIGFLAEFQARYYALKIHKYLRIRIFSLLKGFWDLEFVKFSKYKKRSGFGDLEVVCWS
jgi:hypothetical protein